MQQTSKQLDNTNQQLQQSSTSLTKPTINKPLYNTLDTGDYFYEPTKLQTSWGTYGTDGNLIQKQSVIQPTPQPLLEEVIELILLLDLEFIKEEITFEKLLIFIHLVK